MRHAGLGEELHELSLRYWQKPGACLSTVRSARWTSYDFATMCTFVDVSRALASMTSVYGTWTMVANGVVVAVAERGEGSAS